MVDRDLSFLNINKLLQEDDQESVQQEKIDKFTDPLIFEQSAELNGNNISYQNFALVPVTSQDNHTQNYDFSSSVSKDVLNIQTNPLLFKQSSESQKSEEIQQKVKLIVKNFFKLLLKSTLNYYN